MENPYKGSSKTLTNRITIKSGNPTSGYTSKITENRALKIYLHIHFHGNIIHTSQSWKQCQCPLMEELKRKTWYIHTMEHYSALINKQILSHAVTWIEPWGYYIWNKPVTKIPCSSTYVSYTIKPLGGKWSGAEGRGNWGTVIQWEQSFGFAKWKISRELLHNNV